MNGTVAAPAPGLCQLAGASCDGALVMMGPENGVMARLKMKVPDLIVVQHIGLLLQPVIQHTSLAGLNVLSESCVKFILFSLEALFTLLNCMKFKKF